MIGKFIRSIFFGNYFVGLLAVCLTLEACLQLELPFPSLIYFTLLFIWPIVYYTYAYWTSLKLQKPTNLRVKWYIDNKTFVKYSQWILFSISMVLATYLFVKNIDAVKKIIKVIEHLETTEGLSTCKAIATALNRRGLTTQRGGEFSIATVSRLRHQQRD